MPALLTCPYCNALAPDLVPLPSGRVPCPRCGESFPLPTGVSAGSAGATSGPATSPPQAARSSRAWYWGGLVLGLLAFAGMLWALWGSRKPRTPATRGTDQPAVVKPADLPGLGYLPESTEAVLAIQVPPLLEKLGPEAPQDPGKALVRLGLPPAVVDTVEKASGVGLKNVDQLVIGLGFEKWAFPPQLVVVVHTRRPYDLAALTRQAKANTLKKDSRTLHVVKPSPIPEVYWWGPNDRVLVGTLTARDYEQIPEQPRPGIDHLRPELSRLVRERVADDACAWLVASSDQWRKHLAPYTFLPGSPLTGRGDLLGPAEKLRAVTLSVPHAADGQVDLWIDRKSAEGGEELRTVLAERFAGEPVEVGGEAESCRLQTRFDPGVLERLIGRLVPAPKK